MGRTGGRLVTAASWLLLAGLFAAPLVLGRLQEAADLWAHLALSAILGLAAAGALLAGAPRPTWRKTDALLLALVVVYLTASLRTVCPRDTLAELMRLGDYLLLYLLVRFLCRTPLMFGAAAGAFAAGAAACGAWGVQEYLITVAALHDRSWRVFGPFYNPNLLAAMLLVAVPLWAGLLSVARSWAVRLFCALALLLCWTGFFLTGSKGGALALVAALLLGAALAPDPARRGASKRALIAVGLACLAIVAATFLPPIRIRLAAALGAQSNSTMFRYYTWVGTWRMALARPVLGFGPGTFADAYPRFAVVGRTQLAHQTYLQVAAETGFAGGLALVAVLVAQVGLGVRAARRLSGIRRTVAAAAAAGMLGFCLHNLVDYGWHVTAIGMAFWVLAGLAAAAWEAAGGGGGAMDRAPTEEVARRKRRDRSQPGAAPPRALGWAALAVAAAMVAGLPAALALAAAERARDGDLRGASRLDPLNADYHQQAAMMAEQIGRQGLRNAYEEAVREWGIVARLRPTSPAPHLHLALIRTDEGRTEEALQEYARAAELAPTWTRALVSQAQFLEALGKPDRALAVYRRLDALSDSPLFRYHAVDNDLDPNFAWAWVALADREPPPQARARIVRAARYLRQVMQANRAMEGLWRAAGEWEEKQGADLGQLAETVARRHVAFPEPGARLRAALLLVDAGRSELAIQLFARPGGGAAGEVFLERIIEAWSQHVSAAHLRATGEQAAAESLDRAAAVGMAAAVSRRSLMSEIAAGPDALAPDEIAALTHLAKAAGERR